MLSACVCVKENLYSSLLLPLEPEPEVAAEPEPEPEAEPEPEPVETPEVGTGQVDSYKTPSGTGTAVFGSSFKLDPFQKLSC